MISKWSVQIQKYREIWEVPIIRYNQLETQIEWWSDRCVYYRSISLAVSAELSSLSGSSCLLVNVNDISALANWLLSTAALSSSPVIATLSPHDNNTSRLIGSPHDNNIQSATISIRSTYGQQLHHYLNPLLPSSRLPYSRHSLRSN